jgi:hypothetical protein
LYHPGVLGSIPKREELGKTGRHPVLKYRVPHGSQCVMGRLVHTGLGSSSLVAHVLQNPPPPHANSFVLGPTVINTHTPPDKEDDATGLPRCLQVARE